MKNQRLERGFSLVELSIVILIMGILLAGLMMPLSAQRENARIRELVLAASDGPQKETSHDNTLGLSLKVGDGHRTTAYRQQAEIQPVELSVDHLVLRTADAQACIEIFRDQLGVRLALDENRVTMQANNPEQEEAEEELEVTYSGDEMEIGFNVSYLQDVLAALDGDEVRMSVSDANSSALIEGPANEDALYVVMPMRL